VFFDINTGIISLGQRNVLRTTNSGFNWNTVLTGVRFYGSGMQKINDSTIYALGDDYYNNTIYRSYNKGLTWDSVSRSSSLAYASIYFVNKDTGFVSVYDWTNNRIWRTINGGVTLTPYSNPSALLYGRLFFLKEKVNGEYYGWLAGDAIMKTTNSGLYWYSVSGMTMSSGGDIYFINKDTGWVSKIYIGGGNSNRIYVSYDGGLNWIWQPMPQSSIFVYNDINNFKCVNKNILYGGGGTIFINSKYYYVIWKTTNGGNNWGYQLPDTSLTFWGARTIEFWDSMNGWVYYGQNGLKTTTGGGLIIFTDIRNKNEIVKNYELNQNYPNPFNPTTNIKFQISKTTEVKIVIYNLLGKEISILLNKKLNEGTYTLIWDASNYSSGVYLYSLFIENQIIETMKMIYIK
jgi:photosystem II stability/assembly factor-like uncharacterized protein